MVLHGVQNNSHQEVDDSITKGYSVSPPDSKILKPPEPKNNRSESPKDSIVSKEDIEKEAKEEIKKPLPNKKPIPPKFNNKIPDYLKICQDARKCLCRFTPIRYDAFERKFEKYQNDINYVLEWFVKNEVIIKWSFIDERFVLETPTTVNRQKAFLKQIILEKCVKNISEMIYIDLDLITTDVFECVDKKILNKEDIASKVELMMNQIGFDVESFCKKFKSYDGPDVKNKSKTGQWKCRFNSTQHGEDFVEYDKKCAEKLMQYQKEVNEILGWFKERNIKLQCNYENNSIGYLDSKIDNNECAGQIDVLQKKVSQILEVMQYKTSDVIPEIKYGINNPELHNEYSIEYMNLLAKAQINFDIVYFHNKQMKISGQSLGL